MAVHLLHMRSQYEKKGLDKLYAYASVSLVRYIDLTTIDQPFYEAGEAARKVVSFYSISFQILTFLGLGRYRFQHAQQIP